MAISFYSTYSLIQANKQIAKPKSFLRDRYFPTNPSTDIFNTEQVLIEIGEGRKKLAPFVTPLKGGVLLERDASRLESFTPPTIAPARTLTADMLTKRGFGEALGGNLSPEQRSQQYLLTDIDDLGNAITRREEKTAADILFSNKCIMKHIADDTETAEAIQLDFTNDSDNKALYVPSAKWTISTPYETIERDIFAMISMLTSRGLAATDLILGTEVALVLKNNAEFIKRLDTDNLDVGAVTAVKDVQGGSLWGTLIVMGFSLNLFLYNDTYEDENGKIKTYIPSDMVCLTAPSAGRTCYGAHSLIEEGNNDFTTYNGARIPHYTVNRENGIRKITVYSHPVLLPRAVDPWVFGTFVNVD